ncbi:MAG TPA: glutaredoxin domain-containing protein [Gammaproteobacteria bacterium]|nr:glutaredoxin domain-containing protein [Gammaproteobacteria bacterium]
MPGRPVKPVRARYARLACALFTATLGAVLASPAVGGEVHRWVDQQGQVHFGGRPPADGTASSRVEVRPNRVRSRVPPAPEPTRSRQKDADAPEVVLYGTDWCPHCKRARAYFKANGIPFTDYDIEKNARADRAYDRLGGESIPLIVVGDRTMTGFSADSFQRLYQAAQ